MARESNDWAREELEGLNLGDARRNERAKTLLARFAENPTASIPLACRGWSETLGAYRFMENPAFEWNDILEPHWQRTRERMSEEEVVLCIQDTTELDFNGQEIDGLGPLNYEARRGMYLMRLGRTCPELDAALFFDPDEIRGAYLLSKQRMPKAPTLNEVLRLIAKLGGFLARKGDGEPGAKTIWEGMKQVTTAAETLRALRSETA
jgi:hypothetical protein